MDVTSIICDGCGFDKAPREAFRVVTCEGLAEDRHLCEECVQALDHMLAEEFLLDAYMRSGASPESQELAGTDAHEY